jgi:hypothetical protein
VRRLFGTKLGYEILILDFKVITAGVLHSYPIFASSDEDFFCERFIFK